MKKENYRKQLRLFRRKASYYQQFEDRMCSLKKRSAVRESDVPWLADEYALLETNNTYVRCVLTWIEDTYGSQAAEIITRNYVEGCPQKEISHDYNLSLRTMQRYMHKWLTEGLDHNDQ